MSKPSDGWEPLEHTADVGVRAWAPDLPHLFEWAARGLLETIGVWGPIGSGDETVLEVSGEGRDLAGVLVDWLAEILYLQDSQDLAVERVRVHHVDDRCARGSLTVRVRTEEPGGIQVKAVTYHRMKVEPSGAAYVAEVYLDV
jgi:SHS2 domain-containing protein